MPPLPENILDPAQLQGYLEQLVKNAKELMNSEECLAAMNANQLMADRLEARLRERFPELPAFGE